MSSRKIKRILNEVKELNDSKEVLKNSGIYFSINEDNFEKIQLLFVGNKDTPYENGFYLFELTYPDNYPMIPPKMKYYTNGYLNNLKNKLFNVRFNPNLYTNGKVCLSMLNTWHGPGWVPTNTISNVIVALQALVLNENPLVNEPGHENDNQEYYDNYNDLITYANYKISIFDQLKDGIKSKFNELNNVMEDIFIERIDIIDESLKRLINEKNNKKVNVHVYSMNALLDYKDLYNYFIIMKTKVKVKRNNDKIIIDNKDNYDNVKSNICEG